MTVTYTINHPISDALETWLVSQADFVSIDRQPTVTNVYYDHSSEAEEVAFKALLSKQLGLSGENVNTSDSDLARTEATLLGEQTFADHVEFESVQVNSGGIQCIGGVEVNGASQFDGSAQFDGTISCNAEVTLNDVDLNLVNGSDIRTGTGTGTKIAPDATRKIAFWGATPIVQPSANADTSGATLGQLETEVNELKALLRSLGLMAT